MEQAGHGEGAVRGDEAVGAGAVARALPSVRRVAGGVCALAAAGALLAGCGGGGGGASPSSSGSSPSSPSSPSASRSGGGSSAGAGELTEDQRERKELLPKAKVGYDKAFAAATDVVADTEPVATELKAGTDGHPVWVTEVATSRGTAHVVRVDAVGGKAQQPQVKQEDEDDRKKLAKRLDGAKVSARQAAATATDKKEGTVAAVELDDDDSGKTIWSVDVVTPKDWNKTTYDIDASNRKVLREHVDRD